MGLRHHSRQKRDEEIGGHLVYYHGMKGWGTELSADKLKVPGDESLTKTLASTAGKAA